MTKISQREARRLRKRVAELESLVSRQRERWGHDYPGGTHIGSTKPEATVYACVKTARALGHAVVTVENSGELMLFALPLPEVIP